MYKIELYTGLFEQGDEDDKYVATVEVIPFPLDKMPEVIMWGNRVFKKKHESVYVEVFAFATVTPSPGLDRAPRCKEEIRDGQWRRPCFLAQDHIGGCRFEVITSKNRDRLLVKPEPVDRGNVTTLRGTPVEALKEEQAKQPTGMHNDYIVLSPEERAKGFQRPVRHSYKHVGIPGPKYELRDLDDEERERYKTEGYAKFEKYPDDHHLHGRFWTKTQLDSVGKGCGTTTTMGDQLAETYARDPHFYGRTFCCGCNEHLPVGEMGEFVWSGTTERVGS